mmetsp:Transcript_14519/g.41805  ORF Transcript_14519/g.41805 Transcript_14519/m.41805 type:complete len:262 (+) Transcript_14519:409-1194(+)
MPSDLKPALWSSFNEVSAVLTEQESDLPNAKAPRVVILQSMSSRNEMLSSLAPIRSISATATVPSSPILERHILRSVASVKTMASVGGSNPCPLPDSAKASARQCPGPRRLSSASPSLAEMTICFPWWSFSPEVALPSTFNAKIMGSWGGGGRPIPTQIFLYDVSNAAGSLPGPSSSLLLPLPACFLGSLFFFGGISTSCLIEDLDSFGPSVKRFCCLHCLTTIERNAMDVIIVIGVISFCVRSIKTKTRPHTKTLSNVSL